jgi:hypothetical protein
MAEPPRYVPAAGTIIRYELIETRFSPKANASLETRHLMEFRVVSVDGPTATLLRDDFHTGSPEGSIRTEQPAPGVTRQFGTVRETLRYFLPIAYDGGPAAKNGTVWTRTCDWPALDALFPLGRTKSVVVQCDEKTTPTGRIVMPMVAMQPKPAWLTISFDGDATAHTRLGDLPVKRLHIMETVQSGGVLGHAAGDLLYSTELGVVVSRSGEPASNGNSNRTELVGIVPPPATTRPSQ